ncbi:MAG TPA: hypothetical protein VFB54_12265 [Burkholderiales bacterium]|nr:hypothetical protein [Burkholderiales bacterium]
MQSQRSVNSERLWYVRRNSEVRGPFPLEAIRQDLLLGRLRHSSEVSRDRHVWQPLVSALPVLSDIAQAAVLDPQGQWGDERQKASVRWADERSGTDRRAKTAQAGQERRAGPDRRRASDTQARTRRQDVESHAVSPNAWIISTIGVLFLLVLAGLWAIGSSNPIPVRIEIPEVVK